jgi:hypothetical protein
MKNYNFKVKRFGSAYYREKLMFLVGIFFLLVLMSVYFYLDYMGQSFEDIGYNVTLQIIIALSVIPCYIFANKILHQKVEVSLQDEQVEIKKKSDRRTFHFKDIIDLGVGDDQSLLDPLHWDKTPTIVIKLSDNSRYELRSQRSFFDKAKEFRAFYEDFSNRYNLFLEKFSNNKQATD